MDEEDEGVNSEGNDGEGDNRGNPAFGLQPEAPAPSEEGDEDDWDNDDDTHAAGPQRLNNVLQFF